MNRPTLCRMAAALAIVAPAALAQSVAINGTPTTPVLCDSSHIMQTVAGGTTVFDLPPPPNNVIILTAVNGGTPAITFASEAAGASSVGTGQIYLYPPSSTPPPYTVDQWQFPASGGVAVGTGVHVTGTCNAQYEAAVTWVNGVVAQDGGGGAPGPGASATPAAVPTLAPRSIGWLALLIAALATLQLRRRGPRRRT